MSAKNQSIRCFVLKLKTNRQSDYRIDRYICFRSLIELAIKSFFFVQFGSTRSLFIIHSFCTRPSKGLVPKCRVEFFNLNPLLPENPPFLLFKNERRKGIYSVIFVTKKMLSTYFLKLLKRLKKRQFNMTN